MPLDIPIGSSHTPFSRCTSCASHVTTYYDVTPFLVGRIHLHENKNIEEVCKGARIFRSFTCVLSNYLRDLKVRKLKVLCLFYYERLKWTICFQSEIFTVFEISTSCQNSQNETLHFVVKKDGVCLRSILVSKDTFHDSVSIKF